MPTVPNVNRFCAPGVFDPATYTQGIRVSQHRRFFSCLGKWRTHPMEAPPTAATSWGSPSTFSAQSVLRSSGSST
jgi:hypothetical protein